MLQILSDRRLALSCRTGLHIKQTNKQTPKSGPLIQRELGEGETLRVSSGSVVAFSTSVQYDVQTVPGFKNVVFGGEGLFITELKG